MLCVLYILFCYSAAELNNWYRILAELSCDSSCVDLPSVWRSKAVRPNLMCVELVVNCALNFKLCVDNWSKDYCCVIRVKAADGESLNKTSRSELCSVESLHKTSSSVESWWPRR